MATDIIGLVTVLALIGGVYWLVQSGTLQKLTQAQPQPVAVAPVTGTTPTPTTGTTPTPTTGTGTETQQPQTIEQLLQQLLGQNQGGINQIPPVVTGNPAVCSQQFHGKCDTECSTGSVQECAACRAACGLGNMSMMPPQMPMQPNIPIAGINPALVQQQPYLPQQQIPYQQPQQQYIIAPVQGLPYMGAANPSLCQSKYFGKCNTECESPNSSECMQCKATCGTYFGSADISAFGKDNYSYSASWDIGVANSR